MQPIHRYDTKDRHHYLLEKHYTFKLKPKLLYVGYLKKQRDFCEENHSHDFLEIVFVSSGEGDVWIDGQKSNIKKGDIIVYNAGCEHYEVSSNDDPLELKFLAFDKLEITDLPKNWLIPPAYGNIFPSGDLEETFKNYFDMLINEFNNKDRFYVEVGGNMARTLLMYLFRLINRHESTDKLISSNKILEVAEQYIEEHFKQNISLEDVAQNCYANKYYLSHLFSESKGMSVGKYILNKKLDHAKGLLKTTDLSVLEIANKIGLNESSYFCRIFKKETGKTPLAYKKESYL